MNSFEELRPELDLDLYRESMLVPLITWIVVQFLYLLLSGFTTLITGSGGFGTLLNVLFGAWVASLAIRNGANTGDATIMALLLGFFAGLLVMLFFGYLNPPDYADYDFGDNLLPQIIHTTITHGIGGIVFANIYQTFKSSSTTYS